MMLHLEEDHQQIRIAIDQSTWEIGPKPWMIWIIFQHGDSAVDKFNNGNSTMIGAVEGSSYRGGMKDESKTEIQDIVQKIISFEFTRPDITE